MQLRLFIGLLGIFTGLYLVQADPGFNDPFIAGNAPGFSFNKDDSLVTFPEGDYTTNPVQGFILSCNADGCPTIPNSQDICVLRNLPTNRPFSLSFDTTDNTRVIMSIKEAVDRESSNPPDLLDCGYGAVAKNAKVSISDVNDNYPILSPRYESQVTEGEDYSNAGLSPVLDFATSGDFPHDPDTDDELIFTLEEKWREDFEVIRDSSSNNPVLVYKKGQFDFERRPFYSINLTVTDAPQNGNSVNAILAITVTDVQDQPPVFVQVSTSMELTDGDKQETILGTFYAEDGDFSDIQRAIDYAITSGNELDLFELQPTGEMTNVVLKNDFDLENFPADFGRSIQLTITALEVGAAPDEPNTKKDFVTLVLILDTDDNLPKFDPGCPASVSIFEHDVGFTTAFTVTDSDFDIHPFEVIVSTEPSEIQNAGAFRVTPAEGFKTTSFVLSVANAGVLDYENNQARDINVKLMARTIANHSIYSECFFSLSLRDANDQVPNFGEIEYEAKIAEDQKANVPFLTVAATDLDTDALFGQESIRYSLLGGSQSMYLFGIDETTGDISVIQENAIDFEKGPRKHELTLFARDGAGNDTLDKINQGKAKITINIQNVNDERPEFGEVTQRANFTENSDSVVLVQNLLLFVTDSDYEDAELAAADFTFEINSADSSAFLNNVPVGGIDLSSYFKVEEKDGQYNLVVGNTPSDRELFDRVDLSVEVTDNGTDPNHNDARTASKTLTFRILDENDCKPEILISGDSFYITEETIGERVLYFSVKDSDATAPNNQAEARIVGDLQSYFTVDCRNDGRDCDVFVKESFDRDNGQTEVTLELQAVDRGSNALQSEVYQVSIKLTDANDNVPYFVNLASGAGLEIEENAEIGSWVLNVTAADRDEGMNAKLCFSWGRNQDDMVQKSFSLNKVSGEISVKDTLDRESYPGPISMEIVIYDVCDESSDGFATNSKYNDTQIWIQLLDLNDNAPALPESSPCFFTITETAASGSFAQGILQATDSDLKPNHIKLMYRLDQVLQSDEVMENHGLLFVTEPGSGFNRGRMKIGEESWAGKVGKYRVDVTVMDMDGEPGYLSSTGSYELCVQDTNNNLPEFIVPDPEHREFWIPEDYEPNPQNAIIDPISGDSIIFRANDADDDPDEIEFFLMPTEDNDGTFGIVTSPEKFEGKVVLLKNLDRSQKAQYTLVIQALDKEPDPIPADRVPNNITLIFNIEDIDEFPPTFDETLGADGQRQSFGVSENDADFTILANRAVDPDGENLPIFYHIVGGNAEYFSIEKKTGRLSLPQALDRETVESLALVVRVTKEEEYSGINEPFDETDKALLEISVTVNDVNDNPAKFLRKRFSGAISSSTKADTGIVRISAVDPDMNPEVTFAITGFEALDPTLSSLSMSNFYLTFTTEPMSAFITLNFKPDSRMKGSMTLLLTVHDENNGGQDVVDTAEALITVVPEAEQVEFTFLNDRKIVDAIAEDLLETVFQPIIADPLNAIATIDDISETAGRAEMNFTSVKTHFERGTIIVPRSEVMDLLASPAVNYDLLLACRNLDLDFRTVEKAIGPAVDDKIDRNVFFTVAGIAGGLFIMVVVIGSLYFRHTSNLKRKLKAVSVSTVDANSPEFQQIALEVPNTNKNALEGSNPLHEYDESMFQGDDFSMGSGDSILIGVENIPEFNVASSISEQKQAKKRKAPPVPTAASVGIINPAFDLHSFPSFENGELSDDDPFGSTKERVNPAFGALDDLPSDFTFGPPNLK